MFCKSCIAYIKRVQEKHTWSYDGATKKVIKVPTRHSDTRDAK